jgi:hypothetical protein
MRIIRCFLVFSALFLSLTNSSLSENYIEISGALPRGFMKYSGNLAFGEIIDYGKLLQPEIIIQESYSFREYEGGGRATLAVSSLYLLGGRELLPFSNIAFSVKAGAGFHLAWSNSSKEGPFGKENKTKFETKAHLIPGIRNSLSNHLNLVSYIRLTVPSHLILDSYYLGMQFAL